MCRLPAPGSWVHNLPHQCNDRYTEQQIAVEQPTQIPRLSYLDRNLFSHQICPAVGDRHLLLGLPVPAKKQVNPVSCELGANAALGCANPFHPALLLVVLIHEICNMNVVSDSKGGGR